MEGPRSQPAVRSRSARGRRPTSENRVRSLIPWWDYAEVAVWLLLAVLFRGSVPASMRKVITAGLTVRRLVAKKRRRRAASQPTSSRAASL